MPYEPFSNRFPEIALKETRTIIALNDPDLPEDEYGLLEAYCNEPDCDCRRVFFNVYAQRREEIVAVIAYGWESKEFYADWFGDDDPRVLLDMQGPALNTMSRQSELAPALLEKVELVLRDRKYVDRLKRHYKMFKATVDDAGQGPDPSEPTSEVTTTKKVGRNDPCPCGSGKKYKRCCGRRR